MHWWSADHVHLLLSMPTTMAIAKGIQLIKSGSSAWIHQTFRELRNFGWQHGYGAFSVGVSKSARGKVRRKISLGLVSRSTVPPRRVRFSFVSRHFVPGYFHLVPPGRDRLFYCRIFLKLTLMGQCPGRNPTSVNLRFRSEFSTPKGQEDARGFNP